jgi:hypothetical protein
MNAPRRYPATTVGIFAVAVLLLANLLVVLSRGRPADTAFAQQPPIAGGAGVFVMPAQISQNMWGCYLLDVDAGTLCVYQYFPGKKELQLLSARDYRFDRRLKNYNTSPSPEEIEEMVKKQAKANGDKPN